MICAGIDAGSRTLKVVLMDADSFEVVASGVVDQGVEQAAIARQLMNELIEQSGLTHDDIRAVVATGYGRKLIQGADATITEITCQAAGISHCIQGVRTIIDIGGQDSKLLRLHTDGRVHDFVMNDRCAAGTGRFLEVVATRLGVRLACLGEMVHKSRVPAIISNMCVVFAETEIIGLLAMGTTPEDIVAGAQASIATRMTVMAGGHVTAPVVFTGGVAMVPGMDEALNSALKRRVIIAPEAQLTCALGAAILAAKRCTT